MVTGKTSTSTIKSYANKVTVVCKQRVYADTVTIVIKTKDGTLIIRIWLRLSLE